MVFQNYAIWPHMTVAEHVAYPLAVRRVEAAAIVERVRTVLDIVGLGGKDDTLAVLCSGGEQQRIAVARALAADPDLLLLDEPFSNLDVNLREQMRFELLRIQKSLELTVVLVTHDQLDAFSLSDRIGVMRNGVIEQIDLAARIYEEPNSKFVREFIGESVTFEGVLTARNGDGCVVALADGTKVNVGARFTRNAENANLGDEVTIWARPEDLAVVEDGARLENALHGTVTNQVFLGDRYKCEIELEGGQNLRTWVPRGVHPRRGDRIALRIDPEGSHIAGD